MNIRYIMETSGRAAGDSMVTGEKYRITVLTERLLRIEYSKCGRFEDRATQTVINRDFDTPCYIVRDRGEILELRTSYLQLLYDKKPFSPNGLSIRQIRNAHVQNSTWRYGDDCGNLHGTARTLDEADGEIVLEDGLLASTGCSVLDDSASLTLTDDGFVEPAMAGHSDIYFFGYGRDYKACMDDFYRLCGRTPLLPRFALGNWWSRYHAYTQDEYIGLMERFRSEGLPFSVAVIDMDWHLVSLDEKYGNGWTGYTWNEKLFPDHVKFLSDLHDMGLHVTLNVHPADGVRGHEKAYREMAERLGTDAGAEVPIQFDMADRDFLEAYFECLHHPLEKEGVDFWWIDWQQGGVTRIPGLDPLWMLNHYHFLDSAKGGRRPMIFSRFAGLGSHRYPIGFSGDSIITWESLAFQPYFTITAANAGYGWWSHDIGGHMMGYRDDELAARWVQFGVFSPIMRLHSSNSRFTGKEPWNYGAEARESMNFFLRLRHRLIPYLYTMNMRYATQNLPLVEPLYYEYPDEHSAYVMKNEYFFGSELIACPITTRNNPRLKCGSVRAWIPDGAWYDFFTGIVYSGGKILKLYRTIESMPVLAKAGGIVPLQGGDPARPGMGNPEELEICVFTGDDGQFSLYEDDGESLAYTQGHSVATLYTLKWRQEKSFTVGPCRGDASLIPCRRSYTLSFYGVDCGDVLRAELDGRRILEPAGAADGSDNGCSLEFDGRRNILQLRVEAVPTGSTLKVVFREEAGQLANDTARLAFEALNRAQIEYDTKEYLYGAVCKAAESGDIRQAAAAVTAADIDGELKDMIFELLLA